MTTFLKYEDRASLMASLADLVASELSAALAKKGRASLAVPGGTTPGPFFEVLRQKSLDWLSVTILPTDERFVPENSERSNARLIADTLLRDKAGKARFLSLYRNGEAPETHLEEITREVAELLPLDVCLLGMGEDRHTASLFPDADVLDQALSAEAPPVLPIRAPGAGEPRLTLTASVFQGAHHVHLLILGPAKKTALDLALKPGPAEEAPVRSILKDGSSTQIHYAD